MDNYDQRLVVDDEDRGNWLQTFSGLKFYPLDPRPEEIDIKDIARALSHMARFNGHTNQFYSVAQHSVMCADLAPDQFRLEALLHDASESYIADLVRPAKVNLPDYLKMEEGIQRAINHKYGVSYPISPIVKEIDNRMLVTEARFLLRHHKDGSDWWRAPDAPPPYDIQMRAWTPEHARQRFIESFNILSNMKN